MANSAAPSTIQLFKNQYFRFDTDGQNRHADVSVDLPNDNNEKVTLHVKLACPGGGCDGWDQDGHLSVVDEQGKETEIARFITPYGTPAEWNLDLSDMKPLLSGHKTLRMFISTWAGPDHHENGVGWLGDASLTFEPNSQPAPTPFQDIPIHEEKIAFADPTQPASRTIKFNVPDGAKNTSLDMLITGHGDTQMGQHTVGEFGQHNYHVIVDGTSYDRLIWRDDCAQPHGVISDKPGDPTFQDHSHFDPKTGIWSYTYSRAGWCPGDVVRPWHLDLGQLTPGEHTLTYRPDDVTKPAGVGPVYYDVSGMISFQK